MGHRRRPRAIACSMPARTVKNPSAVRPRAASMNGRSRSSTSAVSSVAPSASVRAMSTVGTSQTSAARRAAISLFDGLLSGHQHLAAHVPALLGGGQLVLEMHAGGARLDHLLHQLEGVQHPAEAGLGVRHDRLQPVDRVIALGVVDLVGAAQRVVDAPYDRGHGVGRIQRLVGIHLPGEIGIAGHLPARQVDRIESGLHLLHRLVAGQRAERVHERLVVEITPELLRSVARDRVLDGDGATQAHDVAGLVAARDAPPARAFAPGGAQLVGRRQGPGGVHAGAPFALAVSSATRRRAASGTRRTHPPWSSARTSAPPSGIPRG